MEGFSPKPKQGQEETLLDTIKRLKKTSEVFQAAHNLKVEESASKQKPKDQFKIIPPPKISFIEMSQQKENDEPFRGIAE